MLLIIYGCLSVLCVCVYVCVLCLFIVLDLFKIPWQFLLSAMLSSSYLSDLFSLFF